MRISTKANCMYEFRYVYMSDLVVRICSLVRFGHEKSCSNCSALRFQKIATFSATDCKNNLEKTAKFDSFAGHVN